MATLTATSQTNSIIPMDWESYPMNDRNHYLKSPQLRHSISRGDFDENSHKSRTFNRRLRMQDTFTKLVPTYNHFKESCYLPTQSHHLHPEYSYDILGRHISEKDTTLHHK